jgi:hypothetical protein
MKTISIFLLSVFVLIFACKKENTTSSIVPFVGKWGTSGIIVYATDTKVTLNFDCAEGEISKKVSFNNNQFSETGTYTQFMGNIPIFSDGPKPKPVLYEGKLSGDNLDLTIKSEDGKTVIGNYSIVRNDEGKIYQCL